MDTRRAFAGTTPFSPHRSLHDQRFADALAEAIRKPLQALESAAEEAEAGMLGAAKLGLLVATNDLIDALEAVDAEFARREAAGHAARRRRDADRPGADPSGV
jgi:hypothetical protein